MRINERLRRLERQRKAGHVHTVMYWDDDDIVTDEHGNRMTAAEFNRLHPGATVIKMTWGDDNERD